jgi:hypothetical protein
MAFTDFTIHDCSLTLARLNVQIFCVAGQDLYTSCLKLLRVNEHSAAIVIALERVGSVIIHVFKCHLLNLDLCCPGTGLTRVLETLKCQSSTDTWEESQFAISNDRHLGIINFKLASCAAIVAASAKTEVRPTSIDIAADAAVPLAVQRAAVPQICATGKDQKRASAEPRLFDEDIAGDRDYSVCRGEQAAKGVEAVADGFSGAAIS